MASDFEGTWLLTACAAARLCCHCRVALTHKTLPVSMYYYMKAVFNFLPPGISKRYRERVTQLWRSVDSSGARGVLTMH